jgi:hypothetical protein
VVLNPFPCSAARLLTVHVMNVVIVTDWSDFEYRVITLRMCFARGSHPQTRPGHIAGCFENRVGSRHMSQNEAAILPTNVNGTGIHRLLHSSLNLHSFAAFLTYERVHF